MMMQVVIKHHNMPQSSVIVAVQLEHGITTVTMDTMEQSIQIVQNQ